MLYIPKQMRERAGCKLLTCMRLLGLLPTSNKGSNLHTSEGFQVIQRNCSDGRLVNFDQSKSLDFGYGKYVSFVSYKLQVELGVDFFDVI